MWYTNKIRGFYQGFLAYSVIHGATTGLMVVMNNSKQNSFSVNWFITYHDVYNLCNLSNPLLLILSKYLKDLTVI